MIQPVPASRGAIAITTSQILFFLIGYVAVVILARSMGPVVYGTFGVVMSILVWMEHSARRAVPTATAKLIAEGMRSDRDLARTSIALNLLVYLAMFVVLCALAVPLARWLRIENGMVVVGLAALDLPFFGIYTALQGIHLGKRGFYRLAVSHVAYALAKLVGIVLIVAMGVSIEKALMVNVAATVVGIVFLLGKLDLSGARGWFSERVALVALATPLGVFSVSSLLLGSLELWLLKAMLPTAELATVGVYVAALNVARVPAVVVASVGSVSLSVLSSAVARDDRSLVRTYVNQTLRFFLILFLPACLVLSAFPEPLMIWIYSDRFSGGGSLLVVLVLAQGLWALHGIVASFLIAAGQARSLAVTTALALLPAVPVLWMLVRTFGAWGAAAGSAAIALASAVVLGILLRRRLGPVVDFRKVMRIALAGGAMFGVMSLFPESPDRIWFPPLLGLLVYAAGLILLGELRRKDIASVLPWSPPRD